MTFVCSRRKEIPRHHGKFLSNHEFEAEHDYWAKDLIFIDGAINPSGGNPIPLIKIPGDIVDTRRVMNSIWANPFSKDGEQRA